MVTEFGAALNEDCWKCLATPGQYCRSGIHALNDHHRVRYTRDLRDISPPETGFYCPHDVPTGPATG